MRDFVRVIGVCLMLFVSSCSINLEAKKKEVVRIEVIGFGGSGHGSGFYISSDGLIATNYHVVKGGFIIQVVDYTGKRIPALVIKVDKVNDLAILKINVKNHTFSSLDDSKVHLGEDVYVIGFPGRLEMVVNKGIISDTRANGFLTNDLLIHDGAVNPGASGSPLYNDKGNVIAINCGLYSKNGNFIGYSYAIPVKHLKNLMKK